MKENTCNYSDVWQTYIRDYDKFEYDISLYNGSIIENCYPNSGYFNCLNDDKEYSEDDVNLIRFSNNPITHLNINVSNFKPVEKTKKTKYVGFIGSGLTCSTTSLASKSDNEVIDTFDGKYWSDYMLPKTYNKLKWMKEAKVVQVRTEPKISRNSICPCGSRKKFKNCCL